MTSLISPTLLERLTEGVERHAAASSPGSASSGGGGLHTGLPTLEEAADAAELDGAGGGRQSKSSSPALRRASTRTSSRARARK